MSEDKFKPTICVGFDEVLYLSRPGGLGAGTLLDAPVPGAIEWLCGILESEKAVIAVYSSRSKDPDGVDAMKAWLGGYMAVHYAEEIDESRAELIQRVPRLEGVLDQPGAHHQVAGFMLDKVQFPTQKPAAIMTIDDRAHCFMGRFRPIEWYLNFKSWNKRSQEPNVPDYSKPGHKKEWNQQDEDLADQTLECLLDCLTQDRDGFLSFEPSALEYMASMFMEARCGHPAARLAKDVALVKRGLPLWEDLTQAALEGALSSPVATSKSLDDADDRKALLQELMRVLRFNDLFGEKTS